MHTNVQIFVVYLKSNLSSGLKEEFLKKMTEMQKKGLKQLILGDFNFHYGEKSVISEHFHQQGLTQMIKEGSHVQGNIIDQIYVDKKKSKNSRSQKQHGITVIIWDSQLILMFNSSSFFKD